MSPRRTPQGRATRGAKMPRLPRLLPLFCVGLLTAFACSTQPSDQSAPKSPTLYGSKPISALVNPELAGHAAFVDKIVEVTGAQVVAIDAFDETEDGKARGSIYIQDPGSTAPYSGIALYSPSFSPAETRPVVGDILDWSGVYRESDRIGTSVFFKEGDVQPLLIQLEKPTGRPRFDGVAPAVARDVNATDLTSYATARPWLGMLVRIRDVAVTKAPAGATGRQTAQVNEDGDPSLPKITVANELMALDPNLFAQNARFTSITGVVTFAFGIHLAPRTAADIELGTAAPAKDAGADATAPKSDAGAADAGKTDAGKTDAATDAS